MLGRRCRFLVVAVLCLVVLLFSSCVVVVDNVTYLVTIDNTGFINAVYVWINDEYTGFFVHHDHQGSREIKKNSRITLSQSSAIDTGLFFHDGTGMVQLHVVAGHVTLTRIPSI